MRRLNNERGAALLLIIGVIAALAILAATLVVLTANATSNTARDRSRAKAFNVAEAAVDHALYQLGAAWPTPLGTAMTFSASDRTTFLSRFPASEFPSADVQIVWFNDVDIGGRKLVNGVPTWTPPDGKIDVADGDTNHDGKTDGADQPLDADNNGKMFVEAQATAGGRSARAQVQAQRVTLDTQISSGIVLATDGVVSANNHEYPVSADTDRGGDLGGATSIQAFAAEFEGDVCKTPPVVPSISPGGVVDSILSPDIIRGLIATAKAQGSYYTSQPTDAQMEGFVVIQTAQQITLHNHYNGNGVDIPSNAPKPPGFMLVIGPGAPDPSATPSGGVFLQSAVTKYYGILYTDGGVFGNGQADVIGMLLAKGDVDLRGGRQITYNFGCVWGALSLVTLNAQIVPNTWREIQPK